MRTRYSVYNFIVSMITSIILPIFGVLKLSLFVGLYGSAINGLQLTVIQVINYLNICEIAFSLAFRQLLYKPLAENDRDKVLQIYHGARKVFFWTGTLVLTVGTVVAFLFPLFQNSPLNYIETVGTFILFLLPFGLSYYLMGPNFVIIADQREYKINIWIQSIAILRMVLLVVIILLKMPFVWVCIIEGLNVLVSNIIARKIALKNYPWLLDEPANKSDTSFLHNIKYTIIQRLSTLATNNTDNIVISVFMGYNMTSVFGSYSYLNESVYKITNSAITSPINSFGNLFNDKSSDSYKVFTEYLNFATYIAGIASVCIFVIMNDFVSILMNMPEEYYVSVVVAFLFAMNIFYLTMREPIITCRDANGLFKDAKNNAYLLAITKVILSVVLIQFWGIAGVLLATLVTNWVIDFGYNPVLVYKKVFNLNPLRYYKMIASRLAVAMLVGAGAYLGWTAFEPYIIGGRIHFLIACVALGISVVVVMTLIYAISYQSFRNLFVRILRLFKRKSQEASSNQ